MDNLRLILLLIGAAIVCGVYLYSRTQQRERRRAPGHVYRRRVDSELDEDIPDDLPPLRAIDDGDASEEIDIGDSVEEVASAPAQDAPITPPRDEKIIVLNVLPHEPHERFPGSDLLEVFDRAGLEYGSYNVFHRIKETVEGPESVFSVASATEPGSFDITTMAEEEFRGLTLFMVLPGPMRGVDAFADMLATARRIAEQIKGDVTDRNRSTLTRQTAHHIREDIIEFEHRLQHKS